MSSRRLHCSGDRCNFCSLFLDRCRELCRSADIKNGTYAVYACHNCWIGSDSAHVSGYTFFELRRHVPPTVKTSDASESELGISCLFSRWNVRSLGRSLVIVDYE